MCLGMGRHLGYLSQTELWFFIHYGARTVRNRLRICQSLFSCVSFPELGMQIAADEQQLVR